MKCVCFFSGGAMSWAAAKRAVASYGAEDTTLLFTDTLIEDDDLYRFLRDGAENIGAPLVWLKDGRTPFQVFRDEGFLGNSRVDPCSRILKRELAQQWLEAHCDPGYTTLIFGIDWTEGHRFDDGENHGVRPRYARLGWPYSRAPMMEPPYLDRRDIAAWMKREGLRQSRAYEEGFAHDNCGGGCVKAGKGHFAHLLRVRPAIYARWEAEEDAFNADRVADDRHTILRDEHKDAPATPISLRQLRERIQRGAQIDMFDIGGCGCFTGDTP